MRERERERERVQKSAENEYSSGNGRFFRLDRYVNVRTIYSEHPPVSH